MRNVASGACMAVALLAVFSGASPAKSKVHGFALSGVVIAVDSTSKTFTVKSFSGRQTSLNWTDATTMTGGSLRTGEKVTLRYLDKDRKHIATSIHIGPLPAATPARTAVPAGSPTATPSAR